MITTYIFNREKNERNKSDNMLNFIFKDMKSWRDGPVVKSISCSSSRGLLTVFSYRVPLSFSALCGNQAYMQTKYSHKK